MQCTRVYARTRWYPSPPAILDFYQQRLIYPCYDLLCRLCWSWHRTCFLPRRSRWPTHPAHAPGSLAHLSSAASAPSPSVYAGGDPRDSRDPNRDQGGGHPKRYGVRLCNMCCRGPDFVLATLVGQIIKVWLAKHISCRWCRDTCPGHRGLPTGRLHSQGHHGIFCAACAGGSQAACSNTSCCLTCSLSLTSYVLAVGECNQHVCGLCGCHRQGLCQSARVRDARRGVQGEYPAAR